MAALASHAADVRGRARSARNRNRRRWRFIAGAIGLEAAAMWLRGYTRPGNVVVRCRDGHLFTTIWIPGGSLKALRFGPWRVQHCPVGRHWSIVTLVRKTSLTPEEQRIAAQSHDIRLP